MKTDPAGAAMEDAPFVSVVIPVATSGDLTRDSLSQVLHSLESFGRPSELVLVLNGLLPSGRKNLAEVLTHPRVVCIERPKRIGSAPARCLGLRRARGSYVMLTDADCLVPDDWVERMVEATGSSDVACGQVEAANASANVFVRIEQEVDRVRNTGATRTGTRRFPTVANMIARPALLAFMVDDPDNTAEDVQLSLEYILRGISVANVEHATLKTIYPASLRECLARRAKHARGVAFAQRLWPRREWRRLGMRGPVELGLAAFVRIWKMRLPLPELALALALRLSFALFWGYYLLALAVRNPSRRSTATSEGTDQG